MQTFREKYTSFPATYEDLKSNFISNIVNTNLTFKTSK